LRSAAKLLTRPLHEMACLPLPPDLSRVVSAWATLPEHVRLAILTLVQAGMAW
jgi:hypothetical protein